MSGRPMSSTTASGTLAVTSRQRAGSALGQADLIAGESQGAAEHVPQRSIVVYDEQSHVVIVVPGAALRELSYEAPTSCAPLRSRSAAARIPLTNAGASAPQKRLAVSTASSIAPSGGIACSPGSSSG